MFTFSSKEKAEEFIKLNKPIFSIQDILNAYNKTDKFNSSIQAMSGAEFLKNLENLKQI